MLEDASDETAALARQCMEDDDGKGTNGQLGILDAPQHNVNPLGICRWFGNVERGAALRSMFVQCLGRRIEKQGTLTKDAITMRSNIHTISSMVGRMECVGLRAMSLRS